VIFTQAGIVAGAPFAAISWRFPEQWGSAINMPTNFTFLPNHLGGGFSIAEVCRLMIEFWGLPWIRTGAQRGCPWNRNILPLSQGGATVYL